MRAEAARLRDAPFLLAAQAAGASFGQRLHWHVLPNLLPLAFVYLGLILPQALLVESFLGFLGFAVKPPLISWGLMLQDTSNYSAIGSYPWILAPVAFVFATVFAFNALGDGLRDAIDPY